MNKISEVLIGKLKKIQNIPTPTPLIATGSPGQTMNSVPKGRGRGSIWNMWKVRKVRATLMS